MRLGTSASVSAACVSASGTTSGRVCLCVSVCLHVLENANVQNRIK